ncbi:MAG: class I SAM-dependent methyltransferase family protein, partial [Candidatus Micrarchaeota archaeon]
TYAPSRDEKFVYFPVTARAKKFKTINLPLAPRGEQPLSLADALKKILTAREMENLIKSFDVVGDIAIIEIPRALRKKEKTIANALLRVHKNLRVVCAKAGAMRGIFRTRKLRVLAGDKRTETIYKESGCAFKLDVAKVYFSVRFSHERERVASLVKAGETVFVFFAGVGPFPIIIAKRQPRAKLYAIELNPRAYKYLEYNIALNRMSHQIIPVRGDVKKIVPKKFARAADRILMPLPKGAGEFLGDAFDCARRNCVIHFYSFSSEEKPFEDAVKKIQKIAQKKNRKVEFVNKKIIRPYAPHIAQVVLDFRILN